MCPSLIEIGSKTALHKQTDKQTDRHYENNGHLAVNQKQHYATVQYATHCEFIFDSRSHFAAVLLHRGCELSQITFHHVEY